MTQCTRCGALMDIEDAAKHVCVLSNIPAKGKEKNPSTTEKAVE
mgnify:CR=1 FL=1